MPSGFPARIAGLLATICLRQANPIDRNAAIDRQCDIAVLACKRIARTLHAGFEHRAQSLAQLPDPQWFECRGICPFQVRPAVVDRRLPSAAFERASIIGLDGLNIAIAGAPDAQRQSTTLKFQAFGVEVDRDLIFTALGRARPAEQRHAPELREIRGWQLQLDFDFLRRRHEFAPNARWFRLEEDAMENRFPLFRIMRQNFPIRQEPQRFPALLLQIFRWPAWCYCSGGSPLVRFLARSISVTAIRISARVFRSGASSIACFSGGP